MDCNSILVTGGAGFIGSNFVRFLLQTDQRIQVVNLDALTYAGDLASLADCLDSPRHHFVRGSITDAGLVSSLLQRHEIDGVVNFAAESHVDRSIASPDVFIETNVTGTLVLLSASLEAGVGRFLQVSTDEVYGSLGPTGSFTEESRVKPNSPYSASKAGADHLVHAFHHTYGLDTIITRCSNNYGPYQFPEKLLPLMIMNARQDKALPVYGDGLHVRDWLHVTDHCAAVWAAFRRGRSGEVYNIGGNNEVANLALVKSVLRYLHKPESLIEFVEDRPGHDRRYAIDASKIARELGWQPSVGLEGGLAATIEWYVDHQAWLDQVTSGDYLAYYDRMYGDRGPAG